MNTAIGIAVIGALVLILLWQKMTPPPEPPKQPEVTAVVEDSPSYVYPVTYTSSPWYIPAYSYGSIGAYRRYHFPHRPYVPIAWRPKPEIISSARMPPAPFTRTLPVMRPSVIPRISMTHPMRPPSAGPPMMGPRPGPPMMGPPMMGPRPGPHP